jgi:hypothetical protein
MGLLPQCGTPIITFGGAVPFLFFFFVWIKQEQLLIMVYMTVFSLGLLASMQDPI